MSTSGRDYWSLGGRFNIKASGAETGGAYTAIEAEFTKLAEPPPHVHHAEDEAWYVIEGGLTFTVGDEVREARPGTFVFAPAGVPHTFRVDVEPTRVLLITTPAGFDRFVQDAGVPVGESAGPLPIDPATVMALQSRYNIEILVNGGENAGPHH